MFYKCQFIPVFLLALFLSCINQKIQPPVIELKTGWKFMNADNLKFAKPNYDDSNWKPIPVDKTWNQQGYPKYEGYAWYRIKVVIPSSLKRMPLQKIV